MIGWMDLERMFWTALDPLHIEALCFGCYTRPTTLRQAQIADYDSTICACAHFRAAPDGEMNL